MLRKKVWYREMKRSIKIWLLAASFFVIVGAFSFVLSMTYLEWDFAKLSSDTYENNSYAISDSFSSISLKTDTADVVFIPTDDPQCSVALCEKTKLSHKVEVKDGVLGITLEDTRKWYDYISLGSLRTKITICIPSEQYGALSIEDDTGDIEIPAGFGFEKIDVRVSTGNVTCRASASGDVSIKTSTGDIDVADICARNLDLTASTGRIEVSNVKCDDLKISVSSGDSSVENVECDNLTTSGSSGNITLKNAIMRERLSIERSTGDITLSRCDSGDICITTSTGAVEGTLLSDKVFVTSTFTGDVDVPKSTTGGICEITTSTGDITISLVKE